MVSIQKLAPAKSSGGFIKTEDLRQYAAVLIEYDRIDYGITIPSGKVVNQLYGTFTFFDANGVSVGKTEPGTAWSAFRYSNGGSLFDRLPAAPAVALVTIGQRRGRGEAAGKSFNTLSEPPEALSEKIIASLQGADDEGAAAEPPSFD